MNYRSQCALTATLLRMNATNIPLVFALYTLPNGGQGLTVDQYAVLFTSFLRIWRRSGKFPVFGLRVWERHRSGGWHAHFVYPKMNHSAGRDAWHAGGGGRVFFRDVESDVKKMGTYLAGELNKWRQRDMTDQARLVRTWAAWGDTHCGQRDIRVESQITSLMAVWKPLRPKHAFKICRKMRQALFRGWKPELTDGKFKQFRAINRILWRSRPITLPGVLRSSPMRIECECNYRGQKGQKWTSVDVKRGRVTVRNSLDVYLETADGEQVTARLPMPDGDLAEAAPLAHVGDIVRVDICALAVNKGVGQLVLSGVQVKAVQTPKALK